MEFASSSSKLPRKYDVLISFTGEDIRRKFVSHLDSALSSVGLTTFLHHQNAWESTHVQQSILDLCRVVIVVFTKAYSESAWCLHQLQQIIEWHETYGRHVLPVYYEIQPSDVRLQKGDFGKSFKATAQQTFSEQQLEHGISRWSNALRKAAYFFGWDESNYRSDAELVDKMVKSILNLSVLSATKFPVGLQSHVEDVIQAIKNKSMSTEVFTIAICGREGSGKTTLAKAIYNQIHGTFKEKSFIQVIAQVCPERVYVQLQRQLLSDVLKTKVEIHSSEMGANMIRERLYGKRMLIVLDDINGYSSFLNRCARFGAGTVIIITTSNEGLLNIYPINYVFQMKLMNKNESLKLLSWHAFREAKAKEEYNDLANKVVAYCGGIPLVLEVIGSSLFERTKEEWMSVLDKLKKIPDHDVYQKLKISFDRLSNSMEKGLFLDVCNFFVGKDRAYVTKILNGCRVYADHDTGIRFLIERNLIKVKMNNIIEMHPSLQRMGNIISKISGKEFLRNTRMRFYRAEDVLTDNTGTEASQAPSQAFPFILHSPRRVSPRPLKHAGNSVYLSMKLKCISLPGFCSEYLPNNFYLHDVIAIDLKHSLLQLVWKETQVLRWLKFLNLSHSKYLKETPDFSELPSLEQLILKDCPRLHEVHQSIGCLSNLTLLNLKDCTSLSNLPKEIYKLKSLKTLILSGCSMIDLLEEDIAQMKSMVTIVTENTVVKQVAFSIVCSKSIGYISLPRLEGLSHNFFPSIIRSWMSPMNPIPYIHSLCIDNNWDDIAPLLNSLTNLQSVLVQCDTEFQLSKQVKNILVEYFANITESGIPKHHFRSSLIVLGAYHKFFNAVSDNISQVLASNESSDVSLPGDNRPYWLAYMGEGDSVSFTVPPDNDIKGMVLCAVYVSTPEIEIVASEGLRSVLIVNYTKCTLQIHMHGKTISFNDIDWQAIRSNLGSGDKVEIFVNFSQGLVVKNTYVYLICGDSHYLEKEPTPNKNYLLRLIMKIVMCDFW